METNKRKGSREVRLQPDAWGASGYFNGYCSEQWKEERTKLKTASQDELVQYFSSAEQWAPRFIFVALHPSFLLHLISEHCQARQE